MTYNVLIIKSIKNDIKDHIHALTHIINALFDNDVNIDTMVLTEDGEYLKNGRVVVHDYIFTEYDKIFSFIKNDENTFPFVFSDLKKYSNNYCHVYSDMIHKKHNAEKIAEAIILNKLKIKSPYSKHLDLSNDSETILKNNFKDLFLPIDIIETEHTSHNNHHNKTLIYKASDFYNHLEERRLNTLSLTVREHIKGEHIYVCVLPITRGKKNYISFPYMVSGIRLDKDVSLKLEEVIHELAEVYYDKEAVVYHVVYNHKRGFYIQSTCPLVLYLILYREMTMNLIEGYGLSAKEIVDAL